MKIVWKVLQILLGLFFMYAGVKHFMNPSPYEPFVPAFLPAKTMMVYASGVVEFILGLMVVIPKYTKLGALGIIILMIVFLPIHVWDVFSEAPAMKTHRAALIRLPIQFVFIAWAYVVRRFCGR